MGSPEIKQMTLEKWGTKENGEKGLEIKPTRDTPINQVEAKKKLVYAFKKLLKVKPRRNVEIKAYWSGRRGKYYEKTLKHDIKKTVRGEEIIVEAPIVIKQIAMLSAEKGIPEGISVKTVDMWDMGPLKGELIIDTKKKEERGFLKEFSTLSNYFLTDQDYGNVFLSVVRELDPRYANKSLQEIGKDLKAQKWNKKK